MAVKGAKTIAEYAIRKWMQNQGFVMSAFKLTMCGSGGIIEDRNGDKMILVYDKDEKAVYVRE